MEIKKVEGDQYNLKYVTLPIIWKGWRDAKHFRNTERSNKTNRYQSKLKRNNNPWGGLEKCRKDIKT